MTLVTILTAITAAPTHSPRARVARRAAALAALTLAGALLGACGSDDSGDPTNQASVPASGGGRGQGLAPLADCVRQNGVDLPESPTRAQLLDVVRDVDKAKREQIRQACGSLVPSGLADWLGSRSASPSAS
jgi:hypothetical protein